MKRLSRAAALVVLLPFSLALAATESTPPRQGPNGKDATLQTTQPSGYGQLNVSSVTMTFPPPADPPPDPSICMSNGGMPFTVTPESMQVNGWVVNGRSMIGGTGLAALKAVGVYKATVAFDGVSKTLTASCDSAADGMAVDYCDGFAVVGVGRGWFKIEVFANITARNDAVGGKGPYSGHGLVSQVNCK